MRLKNRRIEDRREKGEITREHSREDVNTVYTINLDTTLHDTIYSTVLD